MGPWPHVGQNHDNHIGTQYLLRLCTVLYTNTPSVSSLTPSCSLSTPSLLPLKRPCSLSRPETAISNPKFGVDIVYIYGRMIPRPYPIRSYPILRHICKAAFSFSFLVVSVVLGLLLGLEGIRGVSIEWLVSLMFVCLCALDRSIDGVEGEERRVNQARKEGKKRKEKKRKEKKRKERCIYIYVCISVVTVVSYAELERK